MTKRELNKLPAGGLTATLLHGLGLKELVNVALHCFEKWRFSPTPTPEGLGHLQARNE